MKLPLDSQEQHAHRSRAAVLLCYDRLERQDAQRLGGFRSFADVQAGLSNLQIVHTFQPVRETLSTLDPSLRLYSDTSSFMETSFSGEVDTAIFWGLLYLLVEVSASDHRSLVRFSRMLKTIGHKIEIFNAYCENEAKSDQVKEAALDVHIELISFFTDGICFLRDTEEYERVSEDAWHLLTPSYNSFLNTLDEILQRVEKLARLAAHVDEVRKLQQLLAFTPALLDNEVRLPCIVLPAARNARFYDRDNVIARIDTRFQPDSESHEFHSLALYGLGGVGKSHVALKYAHGKTQELDAILWIQSETALAMEESFSNIAMRLKLPGAEPQKHEENRIQVLDWLQKTSCKWLLIFDNAESSDLLLKYWPVADHGCALVTTRNHALAYEPAEAGIEVLPFDLDSGSRFVLHLLSLDISTGLSTQEVQSASELSARLSGHALAISQMAGLIHRRSWTIEEFLAIYDRNTQRMLEMPGQNSLDAVWKLSFESLNEMCAIVLGVLSYVNPDSIPQTLFEPSNPLSGSLGFCSDELMFSEVLDDLLTLALIKREKTTRTLSLHRLVQTKFKYFLPASGKQKAFEDAVKLLFEAFPQSDAKRGQLYDRWTQCQLYSQHVLRLKMNYKEAAAGSEPLKPNTRFCKLLKSFARFLLESASYEEVEDVLQVARHAFNALEVEKQDHDLLADICASTGLMWAHRGLFQRAEPELRQANSIRTSAIPLDRLELSWTEVNLGNLKGSMIQYEEALELQLKALRDRQVAAGDDTGVMKPQGLLFQNMGRSNYYLGRFLEAHVWCHMAISLLSESQNWAMLAYTYFVLGNLHRAENNLKLAQQAFETAQNTWLNSGQMRTHHFNGACIYKIGCVAFDLGNRDTAMFVPRPTCTFFLRSSIDFCVSKHLREALVIAQLHQQVLVGDYARVLHKLSEVLATEDRGEHEAALKGDEAKSLLLARATTSEVGGGDSEKPYDDLVYVLWR